MLDDLVMGKHEIVELAARLLELGQLSDRREPVEIGKLCWAFTRAVLTHLHREDKLFAEHLGRSNTAACQSILDKIRADRKALSLAYEDHLGRWQGGVPAQLWPEFVLSLRRIIDTILAQIDEAEAHLYPLIEKSVAVGNDPSAITARSA